VPPEDPQALADAILDLYRDRAAAQAMGRRGRRWVEAEFTPQAVAEKYERLLKNVVEET
jgi:colanic acid biosynthesis glycosyl transferase WcaI